MYLQDYVSEIEVMCRLTFLLHHFTRILPSISGMIQKYFVSLASHHNDMYMLIKLGL
uniref:Uncharacterized protein n=1 Tax=Rhizophora mucronata TaxID=61149 RepID=A0A2P2PSJ7_RHIMU